MIALIQNDDSSLCNVVLDAPIGICILDSVTLLPQIVNKKFLLAIDKTEDFLLKEWHWETFSDLRLLHENALKQAIQQSHQYTINIESSEKDSETLNVISQTLIYNPIKDKSGNVSKIALWILEDINKSRSSELAANSNKNSQQASSKLPKAFLNDEEFFKSFSIDYFLQLERNRLNNFLLQAPAGICILEGPDLVYSLVNPEYQKLFPERKLLGLPVVEALPEIKGTAIEDILNNVYSTGKAYKADNLLIPLSFNNDGPIENRYFNFVYQPRLNESNAIDGIIAFVFEVTDYIKSKNELSNAYEQLRLSKEAAELGTFDMNMETGYMEWDVRCRQLFGINHKNEVSFENDFLANLHPEDNVRVRSVLDKVFDRSKGNGDYDVEYRTLGVEDKQLRWVKAKGKVFFKANDQPTRFIGSVLNITEQKLDEQRKNDFIAMVSHELKTPLTSINAHLQILQSRYALNAAAFESSSISKSLIQVKKMIAMINSFLNVSRLESGKIHIDKQLFDISELLEELKDEFSTIVNSHNLIFEPCQEGFLFADRDKIGQVINNFISNAVKYSPSKGAITVLCEKVENAIQISVKDQGIGIKPLDQKKLFDRYYRVDNNSLQIAGFGIGLYLCAEIIQRHNGKIWVESEFNQGSIFYFKIPIKDA